MNSFPWLTLMWALPMAVAFAIGRWDNHQQAKQAAIGLVIALLLGALVLMAIPGTVRAEEVFSIGLWHHRFGVDGVSAPMLLLTSLIALGILAGAPNAALTSRALSVLLVRMGAIIGCFVSLDALWLFGFWVLALLPGQTSSKDHDAAASRRVYRFYLLGGSLPLLGVVGAIGWLGWQAGSDAPFDLVEATARGIPGAWQMTLFVLLALALMMRMAIFPVHSWLPLFAERGPMTVTVLIIGTHMGLYLVVRLMIPLLPEANHVAMPILADLALISAIYGAVLALAQRNLRRVIGALTVSQRGLMLVGLASLNAQSVSGAMLQFLGTGTAITGLMLVIWALESRIGSSMIPRYAGLVRQTPVLASLFLLFSIGCVGFPGSLGFVAEDLLIHGVIEAHPIVAGLMLLATCLNGITLIRAFMYTFLGNSEAPFEHVHDLIPRERIVYVMLLVLLLLGGWLPQFLLGQWQPHVDALTAPYSSPTRPH